MLLWLDLETTGLEPDTEQVLEVGAILTKEDLEEVARFHVVVRYEGGDLHPRVRAMHEANGLLTACSYSTFTEEQVGTLLHDWIVYLVEGGEKVTLAGSGVAHFDRKWIDYKWPQVARLLNYYVIDVGIMRRANLLAGIPMPVVPESSTHKSHRAMGDVRAHLTEMRLAREMHHNKTTAVWTDGWFGRRDSWQVQP